MSGARPGRRAREALVAAGDRIARRAGYELVRRTFYSPLPDIERLPPELFDRASEVVGVDLRLDQAIRLLEDELAPYLDEFRPPLEAGEDDGFYVRNGTYESVDSETLYALLRQAKPALVVELGSGSSSHVIDAARRRNGSEGHPFDHRVFDPFPWQASRLGPLDSPSVHMVDATEIPPSEFDALAGGDVLFVDTTHTVKTGGDVPHLVLEVLPRLNVGVLVHFHDVFLPYEYPREWVVEARAAWAEQYLLQAFLAFNPDFEVVLPAHAVSRSAPETLRRLVASYGPGVAPGAFWIRRVGRSRASGGEPPAGGERD